MKTHPLHVLLCALVGCASISGRQGFESTRQFTLPDLGGMPSDAGIQTIRVAGAVGETPFAESILDDVDELRERDHIDSAEATVRIVSIRLTTDTTFAGVAAVRVQLDTATGPIELCNRTLTPDEQRASSLVCAANQIMDEAMLQQADAASPGQLRAQLDVSGRAVTAKTLEAAVAFEVEVDVEASL